MLVIIDFKNTTLAVEGSYYEGEDMVMYYDDMSGYPGSPPEFEIEKIFLEDCDTDVWELLEDYLDEIEELVLEKIEN